MFLGLGIGAGKEVSGLAVQMMLGWYFLFLTPVNQDLDGSTTAAEGVAVDDDGNIYGAEVGPKAAR